MSARVSGSGIPALDGSPLALAQLELEPGTRMTVGDADADSLLYVVSGTGGLDVAGSPLGPGSAALVLAGERAELACDGTDLSALLVTVGPEADRHAPLGPREAVVSGESATAEAATGARTFRILFGPHNGSTRATLFVGYVPPGRVPWHYHLYDEIVWVPEGPGRLHLEGGVEELSPGAAFRLRPREVHCVENAGDREMTILGVFTPAGSPSAAFLEPDVAAEYRFAGA